MDCRKDQLTVGPVVGGSRQIEESRWAYLGEGGHGVKQCEQAQSNVEGEALSAGLATKDNVSLGQDNPSFSLRAGCFLCACPVSSNNPRDDCCHRFPPNQLARTFCMIAKRNSYKVYR